MKFATRVTLGIVLAMGGAWTLGAPSASADSCAAYASANKGDTYTHSSSSYEGCNTQARIDRYSSGTVYTHLGSWGSNSWAYGYEGYNAGNAYRIGTGGWVWI